MKIRAIRLRDVRRFSSGVALEGLSGGLDVLAGPNEAGKSTILAALRAVLTEKHTTKAAKTVGSLKPADGGAPLIEVDFELAGCLYRVRKTFLNGAVAELRDLGRAKIWRNADADTELDALMARGGQQAGQALLWVDQGNVAQCVSGQSLQSMIEAEATAVSDGGLARRIREAIEGELKTYVTAGRGQATGAYLKAQRTAIEADQKHQAARARLDAANDRLSRLETASAGLAELSSGSAIAARQSAVATAKAALDQARLTRDLADKAATKEAAARQTCVYAQEALSRFEASVAEFGRAEAARADTQEKISGLTMRVDEAQRVLAAATEIAVRYGGELDRADDVVTSIHEAAAEHTLAGLRERANRAGELAARITALDAAIAADPFSEARVSAARAYATDIERVAQRLAACAPDIIVTYLPGAEGRITRDGNLVSANATWAVTARTEIDIAGIGRITIVPPLTEDDAKLEAKLIAARLALDRTLSILGITSIDDAEPRLATQRLRQANRVGLAGELAGLAPHGLSALIENVAAGEREQARPTIDTQCEALPRLSLTEAQAARAAIAQSHQAALRAQKLASDALQGLAERQSGIAATLKANETRLAELASTLRDPAWRLSHSAALTADRDAARTALDAAAQDLAVLRANCPDDARLAALGAARHMAEQSEATAAASLVTLREAIGRLEGELVRDQSDDIEAEVERLAADAAAAIGSVATMSRDVTALQRLADAFDAAEKANADTLVRPVLARVRPFLDLVFPAATLQLGADFAPRQIVRGAASEVLDRVSLGTQEQISVIARLAFGRLLADRGKPAPLVLDDALVYADDQRIEAMFSALRLAAEQHQVIVLTCRERTFQSLGGNRLSLTPWVP
jgi:energy-coupling factor transporter ATP-binding protein EcfA2